MGPINQERTRDSFIRDVKRTYEWYFSKHPGRRVPEEELDKYIADFVDEFLPHTK